MFLGAEVTLTCHGTGVRLSLRAMAPSPTRKNLAVINPRWRTYINFLKKDSIDMQLKLIKSRFDQQDEKLDEFMEEMGATEQRSTSLEQEHLLPAVSSVLPDRGDEF